MNFTPIPCHETLRPFVRNYWLLTATALGQGTQTIFSNGAASLQIYLTQPVRVNGRLEQHHCILLQQNMQAVDVTCEQGEFNIFGAEFVPYCSRMFFRNEVADVFATPTQLADEELILLSQQILEAATTEERTQLLDDFLLRRLATFPEGDINIERLGDVFSDIVPTDGRQARPPHSQSDFTPADLASTACLSQKQFTRVFSRYVGMNPKSYLRLLRFHRALERLREHPADAPAMLADIAVQCGYYDTSHMISDFRDICGFSPAELQREGEGLTEAFGQQFSGLMKKKIRIERLV